MKIEYLHSFEIAIIKILINYKTKKSNFISHSNDSRKKFFVLLATILKEINTQITVIVGDFTTYLSVINRTSSYSVF